MALRELTVPAVPCSAPSPKSALAGASGCKDAPVPGGPGPVLSDRRLCLALDEPQLCNGHMGVRLGKRNDEVGSALSAEGRGRAARRMGTEDKGHR